MLTTADFIISFAVLVVTLPGYIWLVYEAFFLTPQRRSAEMTFKDGEELELRDYFAGQALAGGLASQPEGFYCDNPVLMAERCYALADAMMAVRNRAPEKAEAR